MIHERVRSTGVIYIDNEPIGPISIDTVFFTFLSFFPFLHAGRRRAAPPGPDVYYYIRTNYDSNLLYEIQCSPGAPAAGGKEGVNSK